jgi:hypothetical protein
MNGGLRLDPAPAALPVLTTPAWRLGGEDNLPSARTAPVR